jgi:GMP synthase PP-ATPase subunit
MSLYINPTFASNVSSSAAKASSAASLSKIQGTAAGIQAAAEVIGMVITASATIKDQKLRREFEQQMAELNAEEQKKISQQILATQDQNEKRKIIAQTMVDIAKYRIEQLNKTNYIPYIIGGIVVLVAGYFMFKKSKS